MLSLLGEKMKKDITFNENIHHDNKVVQDSMYTFNAENIADFGYKTDENFRRYKDSNLIYDKLENTDWNFESDYYNAYYVNGKWNKGRTIKLKK